MDKTKGIHRKGRPRKHTCECGNEATVVKGSARQCERCANMPSVDEILRGGRRRSVFLDPFRLTLPGNRQLFGT